MKLCYSILKNMKLINQNDRNPSKGLNTLLFRGAKFRTGLGAKICFLGMRIIILAEF
jgi:hypothetical protein